MKKLSLLLFLILSAIPSFSQLYKSHKWDKKPIFYELTKEEAKLSSIGIKEKNIIQYFQPLVGDLTLYHTSHKIIRVNTDKGIQRHNRVYIPMRDVKKIVDLKARVISEEGKTILLDESNIKELDNVEEYGDVKIFAIEGLAKNTQLEIIYTLNKNLTELGRLNVQQDYTIKSSEVIIRKPDFLTTKIKNYNGFPELTEQVVSGNKTAYTATAKNIVPMVEEPYSTAKANGMKVVYLITNETGSVYNQWDKFQARMNTSFISINPEEHKGLIVDFEKENKRTDDKADMINAIANFVNINYNINEGGNNFEDLASIYSKKSATEISILKVYSCLFNYYEIDYNVVFTSNRFFNKFDKDFFTNSNLSYIMFYFPGNKKYLCPAERNCYLGYPPIRFSNNMGLFIAKTSFDFAKIEMPDINHSVVDREISAAIDTEEEYVKVKGVYKVTGYRADYSRLAYQYFKNQDIEKYQNMEAGSGIEDIEFLNFNVKNTDPKDGITNKPVVVNYEYKSEEIYEELNENYVLNVGRLIGTQSELYQEEARVNPVELQNPNKYIYKITIEIPEGYKPKNLDKLDINSSFNVNDKLGAHFISSHKIEKNSVVISISEKYPIVNIPLSYYDNFKDVINSAFDFSKTSIVFVKK